MTRRALIRTSTVGHRRGVAKLWLILFLPLFVLMLAVVIDIGNLWLARAELETSLEAAALAAVKEWGGAGGGSTLTARQVGQTFAAANPVRGVPVALNLNYTAGGPNNENTASTFPPTSANLIFGSITSITPSVVFSPSVVPTCTLGTVLLDAYGGPSLQVNNSWGINFQAPNPTVGLTLSRVVLDLRAGGDPDAVFTVDVSPPLISDNSVNTVNGSAVSQPDVFGISNAALSASTVGTVTTWSNSQVAFVFDSTIPYQLTINFSAAGADSGFAPGDRIRFGAQVNNLGQNDGDDPGASHVTATLTYAIGGVNQLPSPPVTYVDSNFRRTNVPSTLDPDSVTNSAPFILPNSPSVGNGNDKQSFVISSGSGGGNDFAVRAKAQINVTPICSGLLGGMIGPFHVTADTTAYYTCTTASPAIIRVDTFAP